MHKDTVIVTMYTVKPAANTTRIVAHILQFFNSKKYL